MGNKLQVVGQDSFNKGKNAYICDVCYQQALTEVPTYIVTEQKHLYGCNKKELFINFHS